VTIATFKRVIAISASALTLAIDEFISGSSGSVCMHCTALRHDNVRFWLVRAMEYGQMRTSCMTNQANARLNNGVNYRIHFPPFFFNLTIL
jgi:hypothetical protein